MSFHSKMIKLRKIKGLTQESFALEVGVSRQSVYKWESGQSYPDVEKLLKIARTFGVTVDDMLNDEMDVDRQGVMRPAEEVAAEEERIAREKEERRRRRAGDDAQQRRIDRPVNLIDDHIEEDEERKTAHLPQQLKVKLSERQAHVQLLEAEIRARHVRHHAQHQRHQH